MFDHRQAPRSASTKTLILMLAILAAYPSVAGASRGPDLVRSVPIERSQLTQPAELAFSPLAGELIVLPAAAPGAPAPPERTFTVMGPFGDRLGSFVVSDVTPRPGGLTFDSKANRLILHDGVSDEFVVIRADAAGRPDGTVADRFPASRFGPSSVDGLTVDPQSGSLFILDGTDRRILRVDPGPQQGVDDNAALRDGAVTDLPLEWPDEGAPSGIAFNTVDGHLYVMSPDTETLYELTAAGALVGAFDLGPLGLVTPQGFAFAATGDTTDDPDAINLYVADPGLGDPETDGAASDLAPGGVLEVSLTPPDPPSLTVNTYTPTLVNTIETFKWSPPSPDPAGLAYLPSSNRLLISDSEVNEMSIFTGKNQFESTLQGTLTDTFDSTDFSREPTGVAYDPSTGHLFYSDDSRREVIEVDLGNDGRLGTSDDTVTTLDTKVFGSNDPEGITFNTWTGEVVLADGVNKEIYTINPGSNGRFDGAPPQGDDQVSQFDTSSLGLNDPEGVEFDPDSGTLYVLGKGSDDRAMETTTGGTALLEIDLSGIPLKKPAGVAHAPASNGANRNHLYICDRKVDNGKDPNENDGHIYELTLPDDGGGGGGNSPPVANDDSATTPEDTAVTIDVTANDTDPDGNLDPTSANTGCGACSQPNDGSLANNGDGSFTYTPDPQFSGNDGFVYEVCDTPQGLCDTADVSITVTGGGGGGGNTVEVRVSTTSDDAEETASGSTTLGSTDLELVFDGSNQTVGMRFNNFTVPQNASITRAYVQFQTDEVNTGTTTLTIEGQTADDPPTFSSSNFNISSRSRTGASVSWSPPPWTTVGAAGVDQRTEDISSIIQEIVDRPGWSSGNSVVIIITGTGERTAEAVNSIPNVAPLLHVEYDLPSVNQPPVANDDSATTQEATAVTIDVTANDTDPDGNLDPTSANTACGTCSLPTDGSLANNGDGSFTYTPDALFSGTDGFVYEVCDTPDGLCDTADVTITVTPNRPPVANDDSATTPQGTAVTIDVTANDTDPDGNLDPTSANTACGTCSQPTDGSLANNGNGSFTYTPDPLFSGSDGFVYEVCDTPYGLCDTASVSITVTGGGGGGNTVEVRISTTSDDAEEKASGRTKLGSSDLELVFDGSNQTVGMRFNNFTVPQGANITRAYVQFVTDEVNTGTTTLTIEGQAADNPPTFSSSNFNISSRPRTAASVSWSPPPWTNVGAAGVDQRTEDITSIIQETVNRPGWSSGNSVVIIITGTGERTAEAVNSTPNVAPLLHVEYGSSSSNQPPVANDDTATTPQDTAVTIDVTANDTDPDGNLNPASANTSCGICSLPSDGLLFNEGDGSFTYTPGSGFFGNDGFVYEVCDTPDGLCDTADVSITVTSTGGSNQPPVANDDTATTPQDTAVTIDVTANDTDPDGNLNPASANTSCGICSLPSDGLLFNEGDGSFTYTPGSGFVGNDGFVYEVCDTPDGLCDTADVSITVTSTGGGGNQVDVRVSSYSDDAEQKPSGKTMLDSSDLEFVYDGVDQIVGMRFNGVGVPQGATITRAYIQFQVDESNSGSTSLTIEGQAADSPPTFSPTNNNISSRPRTSASVSWSPPPWNTVGEAGPNQQTTDIKSIIQELVIRPGWSSGNSVVIIVTGTGERTAESWNGNPAAAPLLHVEY